MTTIAKQTKEFRKELDDGTVLVAHVRHDDCCGNGHNSFAITCDTYDRDGHHGEPSLVNSHGKRVWLSACGCQHDLVAKHFPELAPFIKWHLTATDGPLHYIANTLYWAQSGNVEYARKSAVWPDATLAQLSDEAALRERLPGLLAEFRKDVESLGFTY